MAIQEIGLTKDDLLNKLNDSEKQIEKLKSELESLRKTEQDLRESEKRIRNIIENSKAGYFFIDKDGLFQDVNDSWLRMHKMSNSDEIIGKHYTITQVDSDIEKADQIVRKFNAGNPISAGQFTRKCADGTIEWHTYSANPVIKKGKIVGSEGFIIDITERKKIELELKENEEKFRMITEQALMGIVIIQDGKIKYANDEFSKILEYSSEEVQTWKPYRIFELIHPDDKQYVSEQVRKKEKGVSEKIVTHYNYKVIAKSG